MNLIKLESDLTLFMCTHFGLFLYAIRHAEPPWSAASEIVFIFLPVLSLDTLSNLEKSVAQPLLLIFRQQFRLLICPAKYRWFFFSGGICPVFGGNTAVCKLLILF